MTYREIAPTAALRSWVECFWTRSVDASEGRDPRAARRLRRLHLRAVRRRGNRGRHDDEAAPLPGTRAGGTAGRAFPPRTRRGVSAHPLAELTDARVTLRDVWRDAPERITIPALDWADVAAQHGYYDQAHLIDEFRELAGETPASSLR